MCSVQTGEGLLPPSRHLRTEQAERGGRAQPAIEAGGGTLEKGGAKGLRLE